MRERSEHSTKNGVAKSRNAIVAFLALACLALAAASSCAPAKPAVAPDAKTKVRLLHYFSGSLSGGIQDMVDIFNRDDKEYALDVAGLDHESFKTAILATLESKTPPDLYSYWAGSRVAEIADRLRPIDEMWAAANLDAKFPKAIVDAAASYGGRKYLLPITQHYVLFFYNMEIFDRLGLAPPRTWKGFLDACEKIKKAGIIPIALGAKAKWPAQFWFDYLLLRTAGPEYRAKLIRGEAAFDDPQVLRAFELWKGLVDAGYFPAKPSELAWDADANEMLYEGKAAMTLMGTWAIAQWTDPSHGWIGNADFGAFAFPSIDEGVPIAVVGPIDGIVVPKDALNPAGAMRALASFAGEESQAAMSKGSGCFAPNSECPPDIYSKLQISILEEIAPASIFEFNFDLTFDQDVAELGLATFVECLEFPGLYAQLLSRLAGDVKAKARK